MKYRISDIRNFVSTTSCTTIIQAAQKLEISQPALSESLKRLESDLGYVLFYRSRTGIQLTPGGRAFLDKARKVLDALQDLDSNPDSEAVFAGRSVTIGCHTTVAQYSIPRALSYLKDKAPDFRVDLRHDLSRHIQASIQKGLIDVGIVINATAVPDVVIQNLGTDTVSVWSPKERKNLDTLICNPDLFQTQSILKKWKGKPDKIIATDSLELICRLVNEKVGYGIIPERAVELSGFSLKREATLPTYKDQISLVYRPEFGRSPAERLTLDALRYAIQS